MAAGVVFSRATRPLTPIAGDGLLVIDIQKRLSVRRSISDSTRSRSHLSANEYTQAFVAAAIPITEGLIREPGDGLALPQRLAGIANAGILAWSRDPPELAIN